MAEDNIQLSVGNSFDRLLTADQHNAESILETVITVDENSDDDLSSDHLSGKECKSQVASISLIRIVQLA